MGVRWAMMAENRSQVEEAERAGFDCVQPTSSYFLSLSNEDFAEHKERIRHHGMPFEVCSVPLPVEVRVTERGFNLYAWMEHLKRALRRLAELGCSTLTWSDGRARILPLEGDQTGPKEQVLQFLYVLCGAAEECGMTVLVEPLGPRRTNYLNTLDEVNGLLPQVGKTNLSAVISLRELEAIGLSTSDFVSYTRLIAHVQMENPASPDGARVCPRPGDGFDYRPFLRALRQIGYSGVIALPESSDSSGLSYCRKIE